MIRDIILFQKKEISEKLSRKYMNRDTKFPKFDNNLIKVVIGPRRAGKSFFCMKALEGKKFGYLNFDDERLSETEDYDEIIKEINEIYENPKILFFDEIQNLSRWELFVNRLQRQGFKILLTGSNSNLLGSELSTHLTGRHLNTVIFPFSFKEFIEPKNLTSKEIRTKLKEYSSNGGFPEPIVENIPVREYLSTLFSSVIFKDIIKRYNIRHPKAIESLAVYLFSAISNEYSFNSIKKFSGIKSSKTIEKYIGYLEESFLFFSLKRFSYKVKNQLSYINKIYCIDNGFLSSKSFEFSENSGKKYENLVAINLKKGELDGNHEFFYWKNSQNEEVDFVVKKGLKVKELIQVCFNIENKKTLDREVRALLKAGKELKCKNLIILNDNISKEKNFEWFGIKGKIKFVPLWKWMLDKNG